MREKAAAYLEKAIVGLLALVGTTVLTALAKGEQLSGLASIWRVFKSQTVPLWLFSIVLGGLVVAALSVWKQRRKKSSLHVVWHPSKSFWHMGAVGTNPAMQIMLEGTFTGTEETSIQVLRAWLDGGNTTVDLIEPVICPENQTVDERIMFFVCPPLAREGEVWKGKVVLLDQYNRKFKSETLLLPHR